MYWVDYGGQDISGFQAIGTDEIKIPVSEVTDVKATVAELKRCYGKFARIKLFRPDEEDVAACASEPS